MRTFGRYIVADPNVCHGKLTFRGTRILVEDVLDQVAAGLSWETIVEEWRGSISESAYGRLTLIGKRRYREKCLPLKNV